VRQKIRRVIIYLSLFFFPITMNYLSPYLPIDGAFRGVVAGSAVFFVGLFITATILGRAWCAWLCPVAGLSEICISINNKPANVGKLRIMRYSIFSLWIIALAGGFIVAGGVKDINLLYMTENFISVDEPFKYITYFFVLFILFGLTVWLGRRGACHSICWMSPFLVGGLKTGKALKLPRLKISAVPSLCTDCKKCNKVCPMSIDVNAEMKSGEIKSTDCILCGECVDSCQEKALKYSFG
jgi:ferredoxin-type protein NapH